MGGCVQCRKEDLKAADHTLVMEECCSSDRPQCPPALGDSRPNTAREGFLHNHALSSKVCHVKLSVDHGSVTRILSPTIKRNPTSSTNYQQTGSLRETQAGRTEEKREPSLVPPVKFVAEENKSAVRKKKLESRTDDNLSPPPQPKPQASLHGYDVDIYSMLKPQILRVIKKREAEKLVGTMAFDLSSLVVEKRGAISDTYQVLNLIGKGAFGQVHRVRHRTSGKVYALKTISKSGCEEVDNLLNEIEILKTLVRSYV